MQDYDADGNPLGRNVVEIRCGATRVVRGRMPAAVRCELLAAVKLGQLGHLKKDGLKPEIFFHPDHRRGAQERQVREAAYSAQCIAGVVLSGDERAAAHFESYASADAGDTAAKKDKEPPR